MLKKRYIAICITAVILASVVAFAFFLTELELYIILISAGISALIILIMILLIKRPKAKLETYLYEECDPDRYLYEFNKFYGYKKAEYKSNRFNMAKFKAFVAMGKFKEANAAVAKLDFKSLKRDKQMYVDYNMCMTTLALYSADYEMAQKYLDEISKNRLKYDIIIRQFNAEILRLKGEYERARAMFNSLNLVKRPKKDVLSGRLAIAYIDKAEDYMELALKNFELVAREGNRLYIRELARNELKNAMNSESVKKL